MSLENLQDDLETIDGIELATTEHDDDWKGTILHLTLSASAEGEGDALLDKVLDNIPRDFLPLDFDPDERIDVYYDAIEIKL